MYTNELDSVPNKFRHGILTKEDAGMKVMEIIYTNPGRFNLSDMDEDDRSEFLIDMLPKFQSMVERHNKKVSPFGAYLYYSMPGLRMTWTRRKFGIRNAERAMRPSVKSIYETKEEFLRVAMPSNIEEHKVERNDASFKEIFQQRYKGLEKIDIDKKRSAMILALKSAWYLNDGHIEKVSDFCECPKDMIVEKVQKVRKTLLEKSEKHNDLVEKRNRAWYFVCKYREELAKMDENSTAYTEHKRKLKYQLQSWKKKNSILQKHGQRISADNHTVAKALEIEPYKITAYINYAKKLSQKKESDI